MRIYVFDPGNNTGWAYWDTSKNPNPQRFGEYKKQDFFDFLDRISNSPDQIDFFVYENYRIRINPKQKGFNHAWSTGETHRVIGAIELRGQQLDIPVIAQEPSVRSVGAGFGGIPHDPKKHDKDHLSAMMHGYYFLVKRGEIEPLGKQKKP